MRSLISRDSLAQRAADLLRDSIAQGEWENILPSERILSQKIGVSRPVLREALHLLAVNKDISDEPGMRRRILQKRKRTSPPCSKVIFLMGDEYFLKPGPGDPLVSYTYDFLVKRGLEPEIYPQSEVHTLIREKGPSPEMRWVLVSVSEKTQRFFTERKIPAVVAGSLFRGILLPSLDVDYRAVARHAVTQLVRAGHRNILFITTQRPRAGDDETEKGFQEEIACSNMAGVSSSVMRIAITGGHELHGKLQQMIRGNNPPTAAFINTAPLALATLTVASTLDVKIPERFSIICRDSMEYLSYCFPSVCRYEVPMLLFAQRLVRLILRANPKDQGSRIFPNYISGQSLGRI